MITKLLTNSMVLCSVTLLLQLTLNF